MSQLLEWIIIAAIGLIVPAILEARREDGELCLTVLRFYKESCSEWDSGKYREVTA